MRNPKEILVLTDNPGISRSRRRLLAAVPAVAFGAIALPSNAGAAGRVNPPALLPSEAGGFRVLPGGGVYCNGAIAAEGHEIVHALCSPWVPLSGAWAFIETYLKSVGRPMQALCGLELRTPAQLTVDGFRAFNQPYAEELRKRELMVGRYSAVCRTNVVPAADPPKEAMVHAFSYAASLQHKSPSPTFCISGAADVDPRGVAIADGDVSVAGMKLRLQHCIEVVSGRLDELELDWAMCSHVDLCVGRDIGDLLAQLVIPGLPEAARRGIRVHHARPPLIGTEVEVECRGVRREVVVSA